MSIKNTQIIPAHTHTMLIEIPSQTSNNTENKIELEEGAHLKHFVLQKSVDKQTSHIQVVQSKNSRYEGILIQQGNGSLKTTLHVSLNGQASECTLYALTLTGEQQQIETHLQVSHVNTHSKSKIVSRNLVKSQGISHFTGTIAVHSKAIGTQASLDDKNLLLSSNAEAKTRPQLEIQNDDVVCSHGSTVGHLEEEALFYLTSRGIPESQAKFLLIEAFAHPILKHLPKELLIQAEETLHEYSRHL